MNPSSDHDRRSYDVEIADLKNELKDLKESVTLLNKSVEGLVDAWNTAKGITAFVKWLGGFISAAAIVYALIKGK